MKFKIIGLRNKKEEVWTYDNIKNAIYDPNGTRMFFDPKMKHGVVKFFKENVNDNKLYQTPSSLSIVLGLKCNFHCQYCQQMSVRDKNLYNGSPAKVDSFIEILKKSGIVPHSIQIWGGEPLVYWKTLLKLIPKLRELYPNADMGFPTNGSLLTRDKVDFLLKYNCSFFISYDGRHTYRDYPVFDDPTVDDAMKYGRRQKKGHMISILPLQTEVSQDVMEMKKEMGKRYDDIQVSMHSIVRCNSDKSEWTKYAIISEERRKQIEEEIFETLNSSKPDPGIKERFEENLRAIYDGRGAECLYGPCKNAIGGDISVDMDGNVLVCMNNPFTIIGHLNDVNGVKLNKYYHPMCHKKCRECYLLNMCQGTCPLLAHDDTEAFRISCENYMAINRGKFRAVFSALFGMYVTDIQPIEGTEKDDLEQFSDWFKECGIEI